MPINNASTQRPTLAFHRLGVLLLAIAGLVVVAGTAVARDVSSDDASSHEGANKLAAFDKSQGKSKGKSKGKGMFMEKFTTKGQTLQGYRYHIYASQALQDKEKPHIIWLTEIKTQIFTKKNEDPLRIKAAHGHVDTRKKSLHLTQKVTVTTPYELLKTDALTFLFTSGAITSRSPVAVYGTARDGVNSPDIVLHALGMEIAQEGTVINFHKNVKMKLHPETGSKQP